ncbi:MAG: thiamine diphosphokinase [Candidatus Eiseniibacteriota bacterium]
MKSALILANGIPPSRETLQAVLGRASLFVCADGGANTARQYGLTPHAIVGDLDSTSSETLAHFAAVPLVRDNDPEQTDAEKALEWVLQRGPFDRVTLMGATMGRLDHVLGHVSLLRRFLGRTRVVLEDDHVKATLEEGTAEIEEPVGTIVSFFAVGTPVEGLMTENLRYPLRDCRLELGVQDSLSNVVERSPAWVRMSSGEILLVVVKKT